MDQLEGDTAADGLLLVFDRQRADLLAFLRARCGSPEVATDLLHDLWLKLSALSPGPIANPRAYLFRMANNLALDQVRARHRAMRREGAWLTQEHAGAVPPEERADTAEPVDEAIARRQEARILHEAIASLPEGAARALRLYRFEGLGQQQIADIMGISRSGVEKHLSLAMKKLRTALRDCGTLPSAASDSAEGRSGVVSRMEQGR